MSFPRVKPSGYATHDQITRTEFDQLDIDHSNALDKTVNGDTLAGSVTLVGAGRFVPSVAVAPDANTAYTVGSFNELSITSLQTTNRAFTFNAAGAANGDTITIYCSTAFAYYATILDQAGFTLSTIGNGPLADGSFVVITYQSGWKVKQSPRRQKSQTFTSSGVWVCPANVTIALLQGVGGGGGGGGGCSGGFLAGQYHRGGSGAGGGGATAARVQVAVTPGSTYTVTIGGGGAFGAGGVAPATVSAAANSGGTGGTGGNTQFLLGATAVASFTAASGGSGSAGAGVSDSPGGRSNLYSTVDGPGSGGYGIAQSVSGLGGTSSGYGSTPNSPDVTGAAVVSGAVASDQTGGYPGGGGGSSSWPANGGAGGPAGLSLGGAPLANGVAGTGPGAGGGGGGGGGGPNASAIAGLGANGGNGASGALTIVWA